jgi:hypothetical protein
MKKNTLVGRHLAHLAAFMIMLAVPAYADTIGISGGTLIVGAEPGDGNQVFAPTIAGSDLVLRILTPLSSRRGVPFSGPASLVPLRAFSSL